MQHPRLSFPLLAFIRLLVSERHDCQYCVGMNESMLVNMAGIPAEAVLAAKRNPEAAPLPENEKAMLLAVLKAVETPKMLDVSDLDRLRDFGWGEGDILDAINHGARNVAIDIMFNAFKIENDF
jgi:alkylhydroperoxidase family enzyme